MGPFCLFSFAYPRAELEKHATEYSLGTGRGQKVATEYSLGVAGRRAESWRDGAIDLKRVGRMRKSGIETGVGRQIHKYSPWLPLLELLHDKVW